MEWCVEKKENNFIENFLGAFNKGSTKRKSEKKKFITDSKHGESSASLNLHMKKCEEEYTKILEDFNNVLRISKENNIDNNSNYFRVKRGINNVHSGYNINNIIDRKDYPMYQTIESYIKERAKLFEDKIYLDTDEVTCIPRLATSGIYISDILSKLIKSNSKFDLINENRNIEIEDINIALNFAVNILKNKDDIYYESKAKQGNNIVERVNLLKKHVWTSKEVKEIYSFDVTDEQFTKKYSSWLKFRYKEPFYKGYFNVWKLEEFLRWDQKVPMSILASKLGMSIKSLSKIIDRVQNILSEDKIKIKGGLINDEFIKLLSDILYIKVNGIDDCDKNIKKLHSKIESFLDITVEPLICETSKLIDEGSEVKIASTYDDLTGEPLCREYSVMLNFGKPISLRPNICSIKTYVKYKEKLKEYLQYDIRDDLLKFVEGKLSDE